MHTNSLRAYESLKLSERERQVMEIFSDEGTYTDICVAEALGFQINQVTGRIGSLIKKGLIQEVSDRLINGRKHRVCQIIRN